MTTAFTDALEMRRHLHTLVLDWCESCDEGGRRCSSHTYSRDYVAREMAAHGLPNTSEERQRVFTALCKEAARR